MVRSRRKGGALTEREITVQERHLSALELRKAGATYQKIADTLGYSSPAGAAGAVRTALQRAINESSEEMRQVHYERLNHLLVTLWPRAVQGELSAVDRVTGIMDRIARLYGIDAPTTLTQTSSREVIIIDGDKSDYIESLKLLKKTSARTLGTGEESSPSDQARENFNGAAVVDGSPGGGHENLLDTEAIRTTPEANEEDHAVLVLEDGWADADYEAADADPDGFQ